MAFERDRIQATMARLSQEGVYLGTSSWKYPGWKGQLYSEDRYVWRGRYAETRFNRLCLAEYAEVFKTVCVDAAYYDFPRREYLDDLTSLVPEGFLFAFKVTDQVTIKRYPNLPRFGPKAGAVNPDFLSADLFLSEFLQPCQEFAPKVGLLMFEFSRFYPEDFQRGRDFLEILDRFLAALPQGWRYGVEIRNRNFLRPEYFAVLTKHGVAHIYNSWQDMPPLTEQIAIPESRTNPGFFGARLLLKPGRKYEQAVEMFSPYNEIREPYPEGREAAARLISSTRSANGATKGFIFVNNRFEGNALETIAHLAERAERQRG